MSPTHIGQAEWLQLPTTQAVFTAITAGGFRARAVGGAVRNTLMGRPVADIDLATNAHPEDVMRLALAAGLSVHETGLQHGTVTVISSGTAFEVTTLRKDVATDGRHASVAFTTDWVTDASRRDFTINALYCDADGTIYDPLDGYGDVTAQRVRFIGDPVARIREDYLRILRFYRFSAVFGDGALDEVGHDAVRTEQAGLQQISAERICNEILKTLVGAHAPAILSAMATSGVLARVLDRDGDVARCHALIELERMLELAPDAVRRLLALGVFTRLDAEQLAVRLRLANTDRDRLTKWTEAHQTCLSDDRSIRAALYRMGSQTVLDVALLRAMQEEPTDAAERVLLTSRNWEIPSFPIAGHDLLLRGYSAGPMIGKTLRALETVWLASDFKLTREALLAKLDGMSHGN